MTPFRRRLLDYGLAAALLAAPILILQAGLKEPSNLNGFDQAVLRISSPLQAAMSWVVEGIGGVWDRYVGLVDVEEENRELRATNARLQASWPRRGGPPPTTASSRIWSSSAAAPTPRRSARGSSRRASAPTSGW